MRARLERTAHARVRRQILGLVGLAPSGLGCSYAYFAPADHDVAGAGVGRDLPASPHSSCDRPATLRPWGVQSLSAGLCSHGERATTRRRRSQSGNLDRDPDRAGWGRIGAFRLHATHDPRETTKAARAAFESKFAREVDPDLILPAAERDRRIAAARRAHFARMALLSAQARRGGAARRTAPKGSAA